MNIKRSEPAYILPIIFKNQPSLRNERSVNLEAAVDHCKT